MSDIRDNDPGKPARELAIAVVKGVVAGVPFIGSTLVEVVFNWRWAVERNRVEAFFKELAEDVRALSEDKVDRSYMGSPEFSDLVCDILTRVARTREKDEQKRRHFRKVLLRAVQGKAEAEFSPLFLATLESITEAELKVLSALTVRGPIQAETFPVASPPEQPALRLDPYADGRWGFNADIAKQLIQALIAKGLAHDESYGRWGAKAFHNVAPTELGQAFLMWLEIPDPGTE
jgi:hypothetical protein